MQLTYFREPGLDSAENQWEPRPDDEHTLRHGYNLADIDRLARAAVWRVWGIHLDYRTRYELAWEAVTERLYSAPDGLGLEDLAGNDLFVDVVVTATRTVEHTHHAGKIEALRNAVLNSVAPDAPDADTQAIILNLIDQFTPSHLRLVTLWDDPPAWFASHGIPQPQVGFATSRTATVEAGLPEMQGRKDFYLLITNELGSAGCSTPA